MMSKQKPESETTFEKAYDGVRLVALWSTNDRSETRDNVKLKNQGFSCLYCTQKRRNCPSLKINNESKVNRGQRKNLVCNKEE